MKVAVICNPIQERDGFGDFLYRGFKQVCDATHFNTGEETDGFEHYFYIDDGPSYYEAPKFHPATYFAIDFVLPHVYYVQAPSQYLNRMREFDRNYVFTSDVWKYCRKNNVNANLISFAADPEYHKPYPVERVYDWVAIWNSYGDRPLAVSMAITKFINGWCAWRGTGEAWPFEDNLARGVSSGKCSLNIYRANMVNMRVYETMAIGTPLVTQRHKDLRRFGFKEDRHYIGFDTMDEMLEKIQWVLDNPDLAGKVAKRARNFVLRKHTYKHLATRILYPA